MQQTMVFETLGSHAEPEVTVVVTELDYANGEKLCRDVTSPSSKAPHLQATVPRLLSQFRRTYFASHCRQPIP